MDSPELRAGHRHLLRHDYLGAFAFHSVSFALHARDRWGGGNENDVRQGTLARVVSNTRYLVLPSVRVPHLASHLLGRLARELPDQWQARYGVRPLLLETFVHPDLEGICYKAAGWSCVGHSAGRRDGVPKAVWVRELAGDARQALRHGPVQVPRECPDNPQDWAEAEFGALRTWDARLKRRAFEVADDLFSYAQALSVTRRCADRAKTVAAYCSFRNPKFCMVALLEAQRKAVIERMRASPVVLVPQDTTSLNYSAHPGTEGLGPIGTKLEGGPTGLIGLMLHNSHAFTPQGVPLGVVSAECCWARDPDAHAQQRPPDERESRKWLDAYQVLQDIAPRVPETCLVSIGDREADRFELFVLAREPKRPRLLDRACQGRRRQVSTGAGRPPLWEHIQALPVPCHVSVDIPRRGQHKGRVAQLAVRFGAGHFDPPKGTADEPIDLWAVYLHERAPPEESQAVAWMLLTNVPTASLDDALERARCYAARWGIEVFHRTLRTGCQPKDRQLGYAVRLENCLAIELYLLYRPGELRAMGDEYPPGYLRRSLLDAS
ncbi:MAG: IS4 family transposase [Burkholderiaceae bacterium]|nr:IS4 family transposase [Burkholderiaceae bacterium]